MSAQYSVLSSLDYIWELVCTEAIVSTVNYGHVIIMGNILNYCLMGLRWIYNRPASFKFSIPPVLTECHANWMANISNNMFIQRN